MTDIEKLIKYLQSLPSDTKIQVLECSQTHGYYDDFNFQQINLDSNTYFHKSINGVPILELGIK